MRELEKVGGAFALLLGLLFALLLVYQLVIRASQGIGPQDQLDPSKMLPAVATSPILLMGFVVQVGFGVAILVMAVVLEERSRGGSSTARLAAAAGFVASALFVATGMAGFIGIPVLAGVYRQNPAGAGAAFLATSAILSGLATAAIFATGWWALLVNWAALRAAALPRLLAYVGLLFGAAGILAFLLPALTPVGAVIGVVWSLWLGGILLRRDAALASRPAEA